MSDKLNEVIGLVRKFLQSGDLRITTERYLDGQLLADSPSCDTCAIGCLLVGYVYSQTPDTREDFMALIAERTHSSPLLSTRGYYLEIEPHDYSTLDWIRTTLAQELGLSMERLLLLEAYFEGRVVTSLQGSAHWNDALVTGRIKRLSIEELLSRLETGQPFTPS